MPTDDLNLSCSVLLLRFLLLGPALPCIFLQLYFRFSRDFVRLSSLRQNWFFSVKFEGHIKIKSTSETCNGFSNFTLPQRRSLKSISEFSTPKRMDPESNHFDRKDFLKKIRGTPVS